MKHKGKPSKAKKANPLFKGQYASTTPKGTPPNQVAYRQKNFRYDDELATLHETLGKVLDLSDTDVLKLGLVFLARNIALVKGQLNRRELSLMTHVTLDSKRFEPFLKARPGGHLSLDLLTVLGDFVAIQQIEDKGVRDQAFEALHQKIQMIFKKAQDLQVVKEPEQALVCELDLV